MDPHANAQQVAVGAARVVGIRDHGRGQQLEIKWHGREETTWEAASRMRRQIPALVQAFEEAQRQQQPHQQEGAGQESDVDMAEEAGEPAAAAEVAADGSHMREQMEALERLVREQAQQLQQLRSSPAHSPQPAPLGAPASVAAMATPAVPQSRFARKEPRAQDLREYDGASGAKLDEWLDELGAAVDLFHLNNLESVDFGTSRLRGAARQWWNALGAADRAGADSANSLAKALRARFQPITTERTAREQLRVLRQGGRSANDYIAEFQRLRALLPDMSEADALFAFESGVNPAIALEIRKQGSTKLTDALALAARIGGITAAAAPVPQSRAAAAHQMDMDESRGPSLDDRISHAVLNAMQTQQVRSGDQTRFGGGARARRQDERGGRDGRFAGRGGRGGFHGTIPGVPDAVVQQRWSARQCVRCGGEGHKSIECPNTIRPSPLLN